MKIIYEPVNIIKQLLSKQEINNEKKYRKFFYLADCPVDDGVLLFNTITFELIFLDNDEKELLNNLDFNNSVIRYLTEQYFLVPEDFDDKKFGLQVTNTRIQIQNIYKKGPLKAFTILPTTGCNARCFYCFEQGAMFSNMTEKIAHDVANFIERKGTEKIKIIWFGGEPLVNTKAIDVISKDLIEKNIVFTSNMVSNAYLLDEDVIKRAVELWKLQQVQITLDGTENVYNSIKNYVYKNVSSPFLRVLNNIENALNSNIKVVIRLNMNQQNIDDLFELSKELIVRFSNYKNFYIYVARLYEAACSKIDISDVENRHNWIIKSVELQNYIDINMPRVSEEVTITDLSNPKSCMACNDRAVMILPDGHLGKCEHFIDSDFYGSIYSDKIDLSVIARFKERVTVCAECENCKYRSLCLHLKCCSGALTHCDEVDKKIIEMRFASKMKELYKKYLNDESTKQ